MPEADAEAARRLAGRIRLFEPAGDDEPPLLPRPPTSPVLEDALRLQQVVEIDYQDREGRTSTREVEPIVLAGSGSVWYLVGHCRLRGSGRVFRLDRVSRARLTGEVMAVAHDTELHDAPPSRVLTLLE